MINIFLYELTENYLQPQPHSSTFFNSFDHFSKEWPSIKSELCGNFICILYFIALDEIGLLQMKDVYECICKVAQSQSISELLIGADIQSRAGERRHQSILKKLEHPHVQDLLEIRNVQDYSDELVFEAIKKSHDRIETLQKMKNKQWSYWISLQDYPPLAFLSNKVKKLSDFDPSDNSNKLFILRNSNSINELNQYLKQTEEYAVIVSETLRASRFRELDVHKNPVIDVSGDWETAYFIYLLERKDNTIISPIVNNHLPIFFLKAGINQATAVLVRHYNKDFLVSSSHAVPDNAEILLWPPNVGYSKKESFSAKLKYRSHKHDLVFLECQRIRDSEWKGVVMSVAKIKDSCILYGYRHGENGFQKSMVQISLESQKITSIDKSGFYQCKGEKTVPGYSGGGVCKQENNHLVGIWRGRKLETRGTFVSSVIIEKIIEKSLRSSDNIIRLEV